MNGLGSFQVLDNSLQQWVLACAVTVVTGLLLITALRLVRARLTAWAARTDHLYDDVVARVLHATGRWFVLAVALLAGARLLTLPDWAATMLGRVFALAVILQAGIWLHTGLGALMTIQVERQRGSNAAEATTAAILGFIARVLLWSLVLLMILDNLGFDITALVASLGIGGIAVALAVQNILGDVFASLAIALDKPVVIGDFIIVGDVLGTVERVGLKTTHLRSLSGEQIVIANADLLASRIRNYKRMFERRVVFRFGVTYQTDPDRLAEIPHIVRRLVESDPLARFDRAHLATFGESALEFEVVFYVRDPDYNKYMDVQQRINLGLIRELAAADVEFAYPTRTLHIATPVVSP